MGRNRWRAAALAAALLGISCRDVTSPSHPARGSAFALLSPASPAPRFPGRMLAGAAADSSVAAYAELHARRGDRRPSELLRTWRSASATSLRMAPRPRGPRALMMPDGYEGDDQRPAFWIYGPVSSASLPAMAGDIEVIPGYIHTRAQYDGDNATISTGYDLVPLSGGVGLHADPDSTNGPGRNLCWYVVYCHQWEIIAQRTFSGSGGCGMDLQGHVIAKAWRSRYDVFLVDYSNNITIGLKDGNYSSGYKYVYAKRDWGQITHNDEPRATGTKCETETCSIGVDGDGSGETGGGVTGQAARIPSAPRFDCNFNGGSGGSVAWVTKVCITWETGYYDLSNGARVVLATWVKCYIIDENGGVYLMDRAGDAPLAFGDEQGARPATAGGGSAASERRVTIVGVNGLPGASPTRVVRRRSGPLTDAVLVDLARARPEDIESAIAGLRVMLAVQPDSAAAAVDGTIAFSDLGEGWMHSRRRQAADRLAALAAAPVRDIPGLGRVRALEMVVSVPHVRSVGPVATR